MSPFYDGTPIYRQVFASFFASFEFQIVTKIQLPLVTNKLVLTFISYALFCFKFSATKRVL